MRSALDALRREIYSKYASAVGLPSPYTYLHGNPVRPVVPYDTATDGLMIIGAYPSAQFEPIGRYAAVPVRDNVAPFFPEVYFNGRRFKTIPSSEELEKVYLSPLGIDRSRCWITDLVKVFLFKPGHIRAYHALGVDQPAVETRSMFRAIASHPANMNWLAREAVVAKPRLILTLGREVASALTASQMVLLPTRF